MANNGDLAVSYIKNRFRENNCCKVPKVIIMDIDMPVKDGIVASSEILEFLKAEGEKNFKIFVHSAFMSSDYK